jgi:hypothetical protein
MTGVMAIKLVSIEVQRSGSMLRSSSCVPHGGLADTFSLLANAGHWWRPNGALAFSHNPCAGLIRCRDRKQHRRARGVSGRDDRGLVLWDVRKTSRTAWLPTSPHHSAQGLP